MEARLRPLNGLLGLCLPGDLNPTPLADAGFRLIALEVPVGVGADRVVVDAVLLHEASALLLACECKSGANVEPAQARKYAGLDAVALAQAASFDMRTGRPSVAPLYVCLAQHDERIALGLTAAGLAAPRIAVGARHVTLHNRADAPSPLAAAWPHASVNLPAALPRIIPCDSESPAAVVLAQVRAVLVSHLSRRTAQVASKVIASETLTHLPIYGDGARRRFERTVDSCLRTIANEQPDVFRFDGSTGSRDAVIWFLKTPENHDNRGRTQAYQALARPRHTGRRPQPQDPDQLDLLSELAAATNDADEPDDSEGGFS